MAQAEHQLPPAPQWIYMILISPDPDQPRQYFHEESIAELADTMDQHGLVTAIFVRPDPNRTGHYIIIGGERRFRAAQSLGWKKIPAIVMEGENIDFLLIQLLENLRENLNPIEEARSFQRLIKQRRYNQTELARLVGKSQVHVSNRLRLLKLPDFLQEAVVKGNFKPTVALELIRYCDDNAERMTIEIRKIMRETKSLKGVSLKRLRRHFARRTTTTLGRTTSSITPRESSSITPRGSSSVTPRRTSSPGTIRMDTSPDIALRDTSSILLTMLIKLVGQEGEQAPKLDVFQERWLKIPPSRRSAIKRNLRLIRGRITMLHEYLQKLEDELDEDAA